MRDYQYTLAANSQDHKPVGGNFIKIKSSTVEVRVIAESKEGGVVANIGMSQGTWVKLPTRFETVRIENETGGSVTVTVTIGVGEVDDSALTGTITASKGGTIDNVGHTVGTSAAVLLAADTARRSVIILNEDGSNDIYIGKTGVTTATGLRVSGGQSVTLSHSAAAAIYAIGAAADLSVKTLSELD